MCGRFLLLADLEVIVEIFEIQRVDGEYHRGKNIAPGQQIAAVLRTDNKNILAPLRWGLIPAWALDPAHGYKMFNARAETIAWRPSFRKAFSRRRCLIPADGFYEWQKLGKVKKPFLFSLKSGEAFGMAGLYETWISPEKTPLTTATIITTTPNDLIRPIHDRMPVIVPKDRYAAWLDPDNQNKRELLSLLKPYQAEAMEMSSVN